MYFVQTLLLLRVNLEEQERLLAVLWVEAWEGIESFMIVTSSESI